MLNICISATVLSILPILLLKYLNYASRRSKQSLQEAVDGEYFRFIFVTHKNRMCMPHMANRFSCGIRCSYQYLSNIIHLIDQSTETICLCMYHLTVDDIFKAFVKARDRGVSVRVISDRTMYFNDYSKMQDLQKSDIPVRVPSIQSGLMHHKYMLIDERNEERAKAVLGSMNWTMNAMLNNYEHVILTTSSRIVHSLQEDFEFLWSHEKLIQIS